jgi:hypothetical protein|uniref:thiol oxidase n=1 Tax=viral metagenome TaxID=1070528 RepID=A0A6C0CX65_9ZZZZ
MNKSSRKNNTKKHLRTNKNKTKKIYSKNDYNSGDGMLTSVWGPSAWHLLHTMSFNYPVEPTQEQKHHYRNFVLNLKNVLPCKYCRMNLKTNLKELPLTMDCMKNRDTFSRYIYNLHELINRKLNKKSNLKYCDVRERYEHFRSRCTEDLPKLFKFDQKMRDKIKNTEGKGCTEPLYGKKSKCIIKIVPQEEKGQTFQMDKKCIKTREILAAAKE